MEDTLAILKEYDFPPSTAMDRDYRAMQRSAYIYDKEKPSLHSGKPESTSLWMTMHRSSSSQMMLELPVEGIKIDMFFVKDILEEKEAGTCNRND